jgi:hypothetical protein
MPISTITNNSVDAAAAIATSKLGAGAVLQVVNATYSTQGATTSSTYVDTGLTASITPKFATSKILIIANITSMATTSTLNAIALNIVRGSTQVFEFEKEALYAGSVTSQLTVGGSGGSYLDSPATTSSTTYKVQAKRTTGSGTVFWAVSSGGCSITLMEIAA